MRAVVERVTEAAVEIDGQIVGAIERGLLVYVGVGNDDTDADVAYLADKIAGLRIFEDHAGKMNLDVRQVSGAVLAISAFTLQADCRKGRRPSFDAAADPAVAEKLYLDLVERLRNAGLRVETGRFRQHMIVRATNAGPVLPLLDSKRLF